MTCPLFSNLQGGTLPSDPFLNEYEPDIVTPPGDTLGETLDAIGMTIPELAERIGEPENTVERIVKHSGPITPSIATKLEQVLGTPASFWNKRERHYRESLIKHRRA
jgi:addiction module HigA family antidote